MLFKQILAPRQKDINSYVATLTEREAKNFNYPYWTKLGEFLMTEHLISDIIMHYNRMAGYGEDLFTLSHLMLRDDEFDRVCQFLFPYFENALGLYFERADSLFTGRIRALHAPQNKSNRLYASSCLIIHSVPPPHLSIK